MTRLPMMSKPVTVNPTMMPSFCDLNILYIFFTYNFYLSKTMRTANEKACTYIGH